jgi:hypothetical protein
MWEVAIVFDTHIVASFLPVKLCQVLGLFCGDVRLTLSHRVHLTDR